MQGHSRLMGMLVALLLAGCGGGGGGGEAVAETEPATLPPTVTLSADNQVAVARLAFDAAESLLGAPVAADPTAGPSSEPGGPAVGTMGIAATAMQRALLAGFAPRREVSVLAVRPAAVFTDVVACAFGGTRTTTIDDRDDDRTMSGGDVITIAFDRCSQGGADTVSGSIAYGMESVASATEYVARLEFRQLGVAVGDASMRFEGEARLTLSGTGGRWDAAYEVGAGGITVSLAAPGFADALRYDPGTRVASVIDDAVPSSGFALDGSISATSIGGRVAVATPLPMTRRGSDRHPGSGQLVIAGAARSRLSVNAIDGARLRLDLETGGGATIVPTELEWETLRAR